MKNANPLETAAKDIATAARAVDIQRKVSLRGGRDSFSILDCPVAGGATADPKSMERVVNRALRVGAALGLLNSCLSRSVVLCRLLRENGVDARVAFGLNKDGDRLAGHCWVVWEGKLPVALPDGGFKIIEYYPTAESRPGWIPGDSG
jgi:hypothetical protein